LHLALPAQCWRGRRCAAGAVLLALRCLRCAAGAVLLALFSWRLFGAFRDD